MFICCPILMAPWTSCEESSSILCWACCTLFSVDSYKVQSVHWEARHHDVHEGTATSLLAAWFGTHEACCALFAGWIASSVCCNNLFYWKTLTNVLKWELPRHNFHFKKANQEWYLYVLCHICGYSIIFDLSCVAPSLRWISHINVSYFSLFFSLLLIMLFVVCYFFHVSTFL